MKTLVVLAVSIVLVSILFCSMVMAAPTMPADLQMVQPDPSLPKELSAFWGKWEGPNEFFYVVEKIDNEKASLYFYRSIPTEGAGSGWFRFEGIVVKEGKKYKVVYRGWVGAVELTLKGENLLSVSGPMYNLRYKRVP